MKDVAECDMLIREFLDRLGDCEVGSDHAWLVCQEFVQRDDFAKHAVGVIELTTSGFYYHGQKVAEWKAALIRIAAKRGVRRSDYDQCKEVPGYGIF